VATPPLPSPPTPLPPLFVKKMPRAGKERKDGKKDRENRKG